MKMYANPAVVREWRRNYAKDWAFRRMAIRHISALLRNTFDRRDPAALYSLLAMHRAKMRADESARAALAKGQA